MKIFQAFEECLTFAFIRPGLEEKSRYPAFIAMVFNLFPKNVNPRTLKFYFLGLSGCICLVLFLYFDARTFQECSECIHAISMLLATNYGMTQFALGEVKLFQLIDDFENIIEASK